MEAGGGSKRLMYTPHLKKVLKTYQAAATSSLHGPNSVMGVWQGSESDDAASVSPPSSTCPPSVTDAPQDRAECSGETSVSTKSTACSTSASTSKDALEYDPFIAPPPFPIQQPPIFTPPDQSGCKKSETVFEGEIISCFEVGGEERLCLPQILNSVLREFSLQQINSVCDNLYIYISRCNAAQLEVLKATRVLPLNAPSCGLITKTDAHRLCAALLGFKHQIFMQTEKKPPFQVPIYHECFGRCSGLYMPDLFIHPHNPCIECVECQGLLSPQKFVCHVHSSKETRTCHWGFDVLKWQAYILLEVGLEDNVQFQEALREMKDRFTVVCKRKQTVEESCDPSSKKIRTESYYSYPYSVDPMLVCYYNSHMWDNAFQTYPSVITKDGKALYIPPENFPPLIQKSIPNFRNRLALTPANAQKLMPLMKLPEEQTIFAYHAHKSESLSRRPYLKKEYEHESPSCCMDSEDTFSDTSFSTLSAGTEDGLISTIDEEEEFQSSSETELLGLKKLLNDIDASLRTSIMSEVETLIAKYRKCLKVAVQGKKLYQMELEKLHYTQKEKLRKLRERNKLLEKDLLKYQSSSSVNANEQYESQSSRSTPKPLSSSPCSPEVERQTVTGSTCAGNETCSIKAERREEIDVDTEENKTFCSAPSPTLPKLSPDPKAEPLGQ